MWKWKFSVWCAGVDWQASRKLLWMYVFLRVLQRLCVRARLNKIIKTDVFIYVSTDHVLIMRMPVLFGIAWQIPNISIPTQLRDCEADKLTAFSSSANSDVHNEMIVHLARMSDKTKKMAEAAIIILHVLHVVYMCKKGMLSKIQTAKWADMNQWQSVTVTEGEYFV